MRWIYAIVLASTLSGGLSCARKRPVERLLDLEGNRWPKSAFDTGKPWIGKVTIVNNGSNSAFGFVGLQSETLYGQFHFTQDHLQFLAIDEVFNGPNAKERVINEWNIEHTDSVQKVSGGRVSNVETENDRIGWEQKRYFKVDWDRAVISEAASFPFSIDEDCWSKKTSRMVDGSQEISGSYVGFTLAVDYQVNPLCIDVQQYFRSDFTHTIHYKYSFKQDEVSTYKPYVYTGETDPLMKKYGYFNTISPFTNKLGNLENTFLMNRWNREGTHTYYFAENFPEKYKSIYNDPETGIFARTNKLFADAKIALKFEIKDNDGNHHFGDIRYSFIHYVEDKDYQAPLGYGPSDSHPRTGEIIAANSIIWTSGLQYYLQVLSDYDSRQSNRAVTSSIYRSMEGTLQQNPTAWTATSTFLSVPEIANYYRYLVPEFTYGGQGSSFANFGHMQDTLTMDARTKQVRDVKPQNLPDIDKLLAGGQKAIDKQMLRLQQRAYGPRSQAFSTIWHLDEQMFAGLDRAQALADPAKMIQDILYRVSIHEFGHNLNLRHNFYGSVDAGIDRLKEKDPKKLVTSSVMDYLALKDEIGLSYDWEAYDKAALLYAYSDGVTDSAKDRLPYLYCTDEHVFSNPLCNQFDSGSSPSEVLMSMIERYDESYWMRNFRYGRAYWNTANYAGSAFMTMLDIKRFVNLYRLTFQTQQVQDKLANIPGLNPFVPQLVSDAVGNDLRQAVKLAASFYASVVSMDANDRPYFETYDEFSGGLTKLGIGYDKIFAARFLLGDDAFPLNPNSGNSPVSFVPLRDDTLIGPFINSVLSKAYIESGPMYAGYADLGRTYFALNAASNFDFGGGRAAIDLMRIACYRKASFESAFNLDADAYGSPAAPLVFDDLVTPLYNGNADPYFADEPSIAVIRLNGDYFVAGRSKNPFAAALIARQDVGGILNSHRYFNLITEGRVPECR